MANLKEALAAPRPERRYVFVQFATLDEYEDALNGFAPEGPFQPDRIGSLEYQDHDSPFPIVARFELATEDDAGYARLRATASPSEAEVSTV